MAACCLCALGSQALEEGGAAPGTLAPPSGFWHHKIILMSSMMDKSTRNLGLRARCDTVFVRAARSCRRSFCKSDYPGNTGYCWRYLCFHHWKKRVREIELCWDAIENLGWTIRVNSDDRVASLDTIRYSYLSKNFCSGRGRNKPHRVEQAVA